MESLKDLLEEYDRLGDAAFSTAHDFTRRQRHLEDWAAKARDAIAVLVRHGRAPGARLETRDDGRSE
jgi:hypothetical protein